jgi:uncharacterized protein (DUF362 family)
MNSLRMPATLAATMPECTRRDFLKIAGLAACGGALAAAGCSAAPPAPAPTTGRLASPTASPVTGVSPAPRHVPPTVAVARGDDAAGITAAALSALGGMEAFVGPGADVIVKPNIGSGYHGPEYATTTNPQVVGTLVGLCLSAGARRVRVMDSPFGGPADEAYKNSGIRAAVEAAGGQMEYMAPAGFRTYAIPKGKDIHEWPVYSDVLTCDVLIDVPIVKQHGLTRLTIGGKNLLGVIIDPGAFHSHVNQRTADLISLCRPTLTVVDAVRVLTANGPTGGDLNDVERLDTVVASADVLAADAYAATLMDLEPSDVTYLPPAHAMGLGEIDLDKIEVRRARI